MALKVPIIIARFFTLTHYRSRLHHLLLALLQSLPCLHYLLTPFLHTLPITFSLCQRTLKYFHDKMQPFSSLIFHYIFFLFVPYPSGPFTWSSMSLSLFCHLKYPQVLHLIWLHLLKFQASLVVRQQRTCLSMLEAQV